MGPEWVLPVSDKEIIECMSVMYIYRTERHCRVPPFIAGGTILQPSEDVVRYYTECPA